MANKTRKNMANRKRMRLTRKNNSLERPLSTSFQPTDDGVDVVATYQLANGEVKESISTKFTRQLDLEDQEQITSAFFNGYTELADVCDGWKR